jgi:4-hydroxybenzoate polyprenyltransferase/phosphoserine phosphatase
MQYFAGTRARTAFEYLMLQKRISRSYVLRHSIFEFQHSCCTLVLFQQSASIEAVQLLSPDSQDFLRDACAFPSGTPKFKRGEHLLQTISLPESPTATQRPLCVDLDGTLVKSDTLVDSLLVLARTRPVLLFGLVPRLFRGKAAFKAYVTEHTPLDVAHLPYNRKVLQYLQRERQQGRDLYLATGANQALANRIAGHLGIFTAVLASDSSTNLTGDRKLDHLRVQLGSEAFDYIGNDTPDLPLLACAAETMVADPTWSLRFQLRLRGIRPARSFDERSGTIPSILKAARPHQWAKNILILVPVVLAHHLTLGRVQAALLALGCFSLTASATYIFNDLLDIEADRHHPRKRMRPFAAGDLSAASGLVTVAVALVLAFWGARYLPIAFTGWLLLYLFTTLAYSLFLKRVALLDVVVLAGLYTLRLLAGGGATHTPISHWLAGFSLFLFLSLAVVKRFAELENLRSSGTSPKNGRGYLVADIEQVRSFGTASAFAAVVIFAIYISGPDVVTLYRNPTRLWLTVPFIILWLCRVWLLASRGELNEDPVVFALTDGMSLANGAAILAIAWFAI